MTECFQFNPDIDLKNNKQGNIGPNHTLEFDVSFSKELVADSPDDLFLQGDNDEIIIDGSYGKGPPRNTHQARSKEDEDNSSIHHTNNNSFNFSNIFHQMKMLDDSNLNNG